MHGYKWPINCTRTRKCKPFIDQCADTPSPDPSCMQHIEEIRRRFLSSSTRRAVTVYGTFMSLPIFLPCVPRPGGGIYIYIYAGMRAVLRKWIEGGSPRAQAEDR